MIRRRALLLVGLLLSGCAREMSDAERQAVAASVDSAVGAFEAAQRARDAEAAIALMAPGFFMYTDGTRQERDSVAANIRRSFASVQHLEPGFADIEVFPLSRTSGLSSFRFRDSLVTAEGASMRFAGATTLLWELREGKWQMRYGHADHRQVK